MVPRAALAALFICAACGGGGGIPAPIQPVNEYRTDLKFGYWDSEGVVYMLEQVDHTNLWWARQDTAPVWHPAMAEHLQAARSAGYRNVVLQLPQIPPEGLRFELNRLSEGGYLNGWDSIVVYDEDEPEARGRTDAEVSARVLDVRRVMFDVPGLLGAKVGIFYGCENGKRPGIKSFDLVGCFRYEGSGCAKLDSDYAGLRSQLALGARLWLIPGGAHINGKEGRQEPACWASYAHRTADVWGIVGFMWQSGADPRNDIKGIRDMPDIRKLYCEMGRRILGQESKC